MSLWKHFGEPGDDGKHGGHLFWSEALGGIPFRGSNAPLLTREELETQVNVVWDFKFDDFDLSLEDDRAQFQYVMDRAVNKWFYIHHIERHWYKDEKKYIIHVEWSQRYGELSPVAKTSLRSRSYGPPVPTPTIPPVRVANGTILASEGRTYPLAGFQKSSLGPGTGDDH